MKRLDEDVSQLVRQRYMKHEDETLEDLIQDVVIVLLNALRSLKKCKVSHNIDDNLVVTIHRHIYFFER